MKNKISCRTVSRGKRRINKSLDVSLNLLSASLVISAHQAVGAFSPTSAMAEDVMTFSSKDEEIRYWKERATNIEKEFSEFQESSSMLELELDTNLAQAEKNARDLKIKCNRLTFELHESRDKQMQLVKENSDLMKDNSQHRENEEKLVRYIRELEQKNDDIERVHRALMETVNDIQTQLNRQIEKNALLETELDEKDTLQTMVQRLKDEYRDLQQELARQLRQTYPDNDAFLERTRNNSVDSNRLHSENATQTSPAVKLSQSLGQLPSPARLSALNVVGDLMRKVGSLESKLATSRMSKETGDSPSHETFRVRNQRLKRGTSAVKL